MAPKRSWPAMIMSLPDDLLLEILANLKDDVAALFRCATACKRWRGLIVDPSFLRNCWPENSFIGFTTNEPSQPTGELVLAPRSALGIGRRSFRSFVPCASTGCAVPLTSGHGLLLVRLPASPGYPDETIVQLAVYNLHAGTCHVLPPLDLGPISKYYSNGYAVLTDLDCLSNEEDEQHPPLSDSSFFKVVIIRSNQTELRYNLYTFLSDEAIWSMRTNCFNGIAAYGSFSDAVAHSSMTHWIFFNWEDLCFYIIELQAQTGYISLTKLPFTLHHSSLPYYVKSLPCLTSAIDGVLSLLWMEETSPHKLVIWRQQEDQQSVDITSKWVCTRTITLTQTRKTSEGRKMYMFGEKCGILLISDENDDMYIANLLTGAMEEVVDSPPKALPVEAIPLELNWPALFVSRLG